eukprot:PITA_08282
MLEYDLEIKPTKLIKGRGLVKLMADSNLHALDINLIATMSHDEDGGTLIQLKKMVEFCNKYNITLGHSTAYYPQGNGLAESSNKSLVNIIKNILEVNKKNWHQKLVNGLWVNRVSSKKSIGMLPFELVYGTNTVFPTSLAVPVMRLLQEA